jgi:hypothetical protein
MRKILLICLVTVGFDSAAIAQKSEQEVRTLLMHKWKITAMQLKGETIPMTDEMSEFFVFKPNNIFIDINDNKPSKGTWAYNSKTKIITTRNDNEVQLHEIVNISLTDLIMTAKTDEGMSKLLLKRVD